jgi:hypothetical protein
MDCIALSFYFLLVSLFFLFFFYRSSEAYYTEAVACLRRVCILWSWFMRSGDWQMYMSLSRPREIREHFNFFAKKRSGALNCTKGVGFREKLVLSSSISGGGGCYRCCCCCCFYCSCIRGTDMNARRVAQDGARKMQFTVMRNEFWPKWRLFKRKLTRCLLLTILIAGNIVFIVFTVLRENVSHSRTFHGIDFDLWALRSVS